MLLQTIRDRAQGWFAYTIIGLLIIPFAVWGINYYFEGGGPMDAAAVGDSKISVQDFQRAYQRQRQQMQEMFGGTIDASLLEGPRLKEEVLRQLINERVLTQVAQEQGLRVSDQQLHAALVSLPVFQQSGGFNKEMYERLLRNQGFNAPAFEEGLRQSLATEQLRDGIITSTLITPAELERVIALFKQQRELEYVTLSLERYRSQIAVQDSAIKDYFTQNASRFVNPEQVQVQFVELKLGTVADGIVLSEDDLKAAYEEQLSKYGRPEERQASHILLKVAASASAQEIEQAKAKVQQLATALQTGAKSFDQALQEVKADASGQWEGGGLGTIGKGMYEDPALETALFALKQAGDLSEVVRMPEGFHLVRLDGITPAQAKPFEEVRETVAKDVRQQKAETQFYEITQNLANLVYEHRDSLEPAAKTLNVPIQESTWFSRKTNGEGIVASPKVAESAFSEDVLKRGLNSEPIEVAHGHVVVIRNKGHREATPRTLEEAHQEIAQILRDTQARAAIAKDVEAVKARATQGANLQIIAKEFNGTFHKPGLVGRDASTVDRAILEVAFRLPQPDADKIALGSTALANGDQVVLEVARVTLGAKDALSEEERKSLAQQLAQQMGSSQFDSLLDSVRSKTKIVTHTDRL